VLCCIHHLARIILKIPNQLLFLFLLSAATASAWDPTGHIMIAQIAYDRLTPTAKANVDRSIAAFSGKVGAPYTPVTAACWMDDARSKTKAYNKWHYIELPYNAEAEPWPTDGGENAVWGIELAQDIIAGKKTQPDVDKDMALAILLHLVGDIHQPLHSTSRWGDQGGNKVKLKNITDPVLETFPASKNLHFFWDTSYRRAFKDGQAGESFSVPQPMYENPIPGHNATVPVAKEQAARMIKAHPEALQPEQGDAVAWAKESHKLGYTLGYQQLPGGDFANPATLDAKYVDDARLCAETRIVEAGVRLGNLLNELYGK